MGFIDDHTDVMATLRDVLAGMTANIAERAGASLALRSLELPSIPTQIRTMPRSAEWPGLSAFRKHPTRHRSSDLEVSPTAGRGRTLCLRRHRDERRSAGGMRAGTATVHNFAS